ncbi:MAG: hypothetical protein M1820_001522 [Bogoriella megaspora]|nr:MAG: hypothetical protein M1820_001522 [Bogoriella megaspora]
MASIKLQRQDYLSSFDSDLSLSKSLVESDYGSDFDTDGDEVVEGLLSLLEKGPTKSLPLEPIDEDGPSFPPGTAVIPKISPSAAVEVDLGLRGLPRTAHEASVEIEYDELSRKAFTILAQDEDAPAAETQRAESQEPEPEAGMEDTRTPIQRFRTAPKKPLSVTDIAQPAWCELQYWFQLVKGKRRKTPAMQAGSKVHKSLEEEIYTAVPVTTKTRVDTYGLSIWNIIQGLRTLRVTGMTRELEVWGLVEGEIVHGYIDELSYTCPDEEAEEQLLKKTENPSEKPPGRPTKSKSAPLPPNQPTLAEFFGAQGSTTIESNNAWLGAPSAATKTESDNTHRRIYITDTKTTSRKLLPSGALFRPTEMQIMLYHHLVSSLITNPISAATLFSRYRLDPRESFSEAFLQQLSSTGFNFLPSASSQSSSTGELFGDANDVTLELQEHRNLDALWGLMLEEYQRTFPVLPATKRSEAMETLSPLLTASYRAPTGAMLGKKTFGFDAERFGEYVRSEMQWWRGEREARGVEIEDAFKCGICDFADGCQWREKKVEEGLKKARLRKVGRRKSDI